MSHLCRISVSLIKKSGRKRYLKKWFRRLRDQKSRKMARNRNFDRNFSGILNLGGAVSAPVDFSSTWRQLNLNFLDIGFSLRCEGSKTIDKPSPNVLGLLRSGGRGVQIGRCVKVRQWKTVGVAKHQSEHSGPKNSDISYRTETPTRVSPEFAT